MNLVATLRWCSTNSVNILLKLILLGDYIFVNHRIYQYYYWFWSQFSENWALHHCSSFGHRKSKYLHVRLVLLVPKWYILSLEANPAMSKCIWLFACLIPVTFSYFSFLPLVFKFYQNFKINFYIINKYRDFSFIFFIFYFLTQRFVFYFCYFLFSTYYFFPLSWEVYKSSSIHFLH